MLHGLFTKHHVRDTSFKMLGNKLEFILETISTPGTSSCPHPDTHVGKTFQIFKKNCDDAEKNVLILSVFSHSWLSVMYYCITVGNETCSAVVAAKLFHRYICVDFGRLIPCLCTSDLNKVGAVVFP